ncbi:MAG: hypothetical protein ACRD3W_03355, partial [Terriglobales bacterium]
MNEISPVVHSNSIEELMPRKPIGTHDADRRESILAIICELGMTNDDATSRLVAHSPGVDGMTWREYPVHDDLSGSWICQARIPKLWVTRLRGQAGQFVAKNVHE